MFGKFFEKCENMKKYTIPINEIKFLCQTCGSEVKFQKQCFLCGEMNWSDEVLNRINVMRTIEYDEMCTYTTFVPSSTTFGIYKKDFRLRM
jgi:hypothetical protein